MLEGFTIDTFSPLKGTAFVMHVDSANVMQLELVEAVSIGGPEQNRNTRRRPFSLVFRAPRAPVMVQRTYLLDHATLGSFELFLVPIGPDESGMLYEAVFT